jgi:hypothetical protein
MDSRVCSEVDGQRRMNDKNGICDKVRRQLSGITGYRRHVVGWLEVVETTAGSHGARSWRFVSRGLQFLEKQDRSTLGCPVLTVAELSRAKHIYNLASGDSTHGLNINNYLYLMSSH